MNDLVKAIRAGFPVQPVVPGPIINTYDGEGTNETFLGKPWTGYSPPQLLRQIQSLSFFTSEAFAYYLPAFMVASLESPDSVGDIPLNIMNLLAWDTTWPDLAPLFSSEQKRLIGEFVRASAVSTHWMMGVPQKALNHLGET